MNATHAPKPVQPSAAALAAANDIFVRSVKVGRNMDAFARIIDRHFQPLLAKVEEKNAELMGCLEKAGRDEDKAITERDAAEDVADQLTSAILGEDIDWPDHGEKWQEAIESVPELLSLRADLAAKEAALAEALKVAEDEEAETVAANKGGEPSPAITPEDKEKVFYNGYWSAAHNIAHVIKEVSKKHPIGEVCEHGRPTAYLCKKCRALASRADKGGAT